MVSQGRWQRTIVSQGLWYPKADDNGPWYPKSDDKGPWYSKDHHIPRQMANPLWLHLKSIATEECVMWFRLAKGLFLLCRTVSKEDNPDFKVSFFRSGVTSALPSSGLKAFNVAEKKRTPVVLKYIFPVSAAFPVSSAARQCLKSTFMCCINF